MSLCYEGTAETAAARASTRSVKNANVWTAIISSRLQVQLVNENYAQKLKTFFRGRRKPGVFTGLQQKLGDFSGRKIRQKVLINYIQSFIISTLQGPGYEFIKT